MFVLLLVSFISKLIVVFHSGGLVESAIIFVGEELLLFGLVLLV